MLIIVQTTFDKITNEPLYQVARPISTTNDVFSVSLGLLGENEPVPFLEAVAKLGAMRKAEDIELAVKAGCFGA